MFQVTKYFTLLLIFYLLQLYTFFKFPLYDVKKTHVQKMKNVMVVENGTFLVQILNKRDIGKLRFKHNDIEN